MWQVILIAAFPFIIGGVIKPLGPLDETIWKSKLAEVILSEEDNTANGQNPAFQNQFPIEDDIDGNYTLSDWVILLKHFALCNNDNLFDDFAY